MQGNIPIPEIPRAEDVWLALLITSVRPRRTHQGRLSCDAVARNSTGSIQLKIGEEALKDGKEIKPGLWSVTGRLEPFPDRPQFIVAEYRAITVEQYREYQKADPLLPRAFTLDIETVAVPEFRQRVGSQLERSFRAGNMRVEQHQRYLEDIAAEEERCFQLGSLSAISGRVLSIAIHVGRIPGVVHFAEFPASEKEFVLGIDELGNEQPEKETLKSFLQLLRDFDCEIDELVGHNILGFDLPFVFQRCLVNDIAVKPFIDLSGYNLSGVFDTMHCWWFGDRRGKVSLDDLAWALGIESSKTEAVEGSKVFDLYQAGLLNEIREYNRRDVRLTRKVYERMAACFGR